MAPSIPTSIEEVDFSGLPLRFAESRRAAIDELFKKATAKRAEADYYDDLLLKNIAGLDESRAKWASGDPWMHEMYDPAPSRSSCVRHPEHSRGRNPRDDRPGSVRRSY